MRQQPETASIRDKLVLKTVRNIRNLKTPEEIGKGMYRPGIKLDLQRSRLLTQSYKETEGEPMVIRRAKGLERILTGMDLYIQDWERIVGNNVPTPQGLFFGIDGAFAGGGHPFTDATKRSGAKGLGRSKGKT